MQMSESALNAGQLPREMYRYSRLVLSINALCQESNGTTTCGTTSWDG